MVKLTSMLLWKKSEMRLRPPKPPLQRRKRSARRRRLLSPVPRTQALMSYKQTLTWMKSSEPENLKSKSANSLRSRRSNANYLTRRKN